MNENVENLVLEHLRVIRADMSSMKEEMSGMRAEMLITRQHMAGLLGDRRFMTAKSPTSRCGSIE
jgi:non-ribosomal peptide synthetase component E (peptide arylation enzyme)